MTSQSLTNSSSFSIQNNGSSGDHNDEEEEQQQQLVLSKDNNYNEHGAGNRAGGETSLLENGVVNEEGTKRPKPPRRRSLLRVRENSIEESVNNEENNNEEKDLCIEKGICQHDDVSNNIIEHIAADYITQGEEGLVEEEQEEEKDNRTLMKPLFSWNKQGSSYRKGWDPQSDEARDINDETLPADTFSMLMTSRAFTSSSFYFALGIFLFQLSTLVLLFLDMTERDENTPFLNPPADVTVPVRISQYLSIPICIAMQDDVLVSIISMTDSNLWEQFHHNRTGRFILSNVCRFSIGLLGLFLSMIIIIQSVSVIDLFKDFAALAFVSSLDDVAFYMAQQGFFNIYCCSMFGQRKRPFFSFASIQREAEFIVTMKISKASDMYHGKEKKHHLCSKMMRPTLLFVLWLIMTSCLGLVTHNQIMGQYLPKTIYVDMGDTEVYWISYFNGIYDMLMKNDTNIPLKHNGRVIYKERTTKDQTPEEIGYFSFDVENEYWEFMLSDPRTLDKETVGVYYIAHSRYGMDADDRSQYDITKVNHQGGWSITKGGPMVQMMDINIYSMECYNDDDCNMNDSKGHCNLQTRECECNDVLSSLTSSTSISENDNNNKRRRRRQVLQEGVEDGSIDGEGEGQGDENNDDETTISSRSGEYSYGPQCRFLGPCRQIALSDVRYRFEENHADVTTFDILNDHDPALMPYGQPVYFNGKHFMVYGGRRWFLLTLIIEDKEEKKNHIDDNGTRAVEDVLSNSYYRDHLTSYIRTFHMSQNSYILDNSMMKYCRYVSEATSMGPPTDGIKWYRWEYELQMMDYFTSSTYLIETNIVTICSDCTYYNTGPSCMFGGTCLQQPLLQDGNNQEDISKETSETSITRTAGTCQCRYGYTGSRCQHPPLVGSLQETIRIQEVKTIVVEQREFPIESITHDLIDHSDNALELDLPKKDKQEQPHNGQRRMPTEHSGINRNSTTTTTTKCITFPQTDFSLDTSPSMVDDDYYHYFAYKDPTFDYQPMLWKMLAETNYKEEDEEEEESPTLQIEWVNGTLQLIQRTATNNNTSNTEDTIILDRFVVTPGDVGEIQETYYFQTTDNNKEGTNKFDRKNNMTRSSLSSSLVPLTLAMDHVVSIDELNCHVHVSATSRSTNDEISLSYLVDETEAEKLNDSINDNGTIRSTVSYSHVYESMITLKAVVRTY